MGDDKEGKKSNEEELDLVWKRRKTKERKKERKGSQCQVENGRVLTGRREKNSKNDNGKVMRN